jgi:hypothetical protein
LLGLIVIAAAGGTVYYYQFASPHTHAVAAHRLVFMTAIIQELGGFHVNNTAFLNQTSLPAFDKTNGYNLTGVKFQDYLPSHSDNKTINANAGDTITFYIHGVDGSGHGFAQFGSNHGFEIDGPTVSVATGDVLPGTIPFGQWYSVTVTFTTFLHLPLQYLLQQCTPKHVGKHSGFMRRVHCSSSVRPQLLRRNRF